MRFASRRQLVGLITVVAILGLVGATLVVPTDDADTTTTSTTAPTTTTTEALTTTTELDPSRLGPEGKELYDLVQAGRASAYHVRFRLSGSSLPLGATSSELEIWRSGARIRQDTRLEEPSGVTRGANFGGPDGTVSCREQPGLSLSCQQDSTTPFPADADFLSSIMERLSGASIVARDDSVIGVAARCFLLDGDVAAERAEICLTAGGAPLVVEVPSLRAEAVAVDDDVADDDFVPPVPVSGGSQSTTLSTTIDSTVTPSG